MKEKILLFGTMLIFIVAVGFGISKRKTYTDLLSSKDYLDSVYVAEYSFVLEEDDIDQIVEALDREPCILEVTPLEDIEYLYRCGRQYVEVTNVLKGDQIHVGDHIYIASNDWQVVFRSPFSIMERGFVSPMEQNFDYVVFLGEQVDEEKGVPIYLLPEEYYIAPVFACVDKEDIYFPVDEESTYVPYKEVRNNEYFAVSEEVDVSLRRLKGMVLEKYCKE